MKLTIVFIIGICCLAIASSRHYSGENEVKKGENPSIADKGELIDNFDIPHSREKRSKKKVVVVNHYYGGQPPYGGYSNGGYGNGYHGYQNPYYDPYYYESGGGGHGRGGKAFKKLKKLG